MQISLEDAKVFICERDIDFSYCSRTNRIILDIANMYLFNLKDLTKEHFTEVFIWKLFLKFVKLSKKFKCSS